MTVSWIKMLRGFYFHCDINEQVIMSCGNCVDWSIPITDTDNLGDIFETAQLHNEKEHDIQGKWNE